MPQQSYKLESRIGAYTVGDLLERAARIVEEKTREASILDAHAEAQFPSFGLHEVVVGRVLGRGGYCTVSEVRKVVNNSDEKDPPSMMTAATGRSSSSNMKRIAEGDDEENDEDDNDGGWVERALVQNREFITSKYLRNGKDARYAVKMLSDDLRRDPQRFIAGVVDLAIEARFLAVLRHPNIVKMRATASASPFTTQFFLVLDKLYDILTMRLVQWKKEERRLGGICQVLGCTKQRLRDFFVERLLVCYDLAGALQYLHTARIIYRDLKPDNIGFDVRGDVKLFDFGLTREVKPELEQDNGLYHMTGKTGSLRYMAPEVCKEEDYNFTADVYSFSILLWEILSLEVPFAGFNESQHASLVVEQGYRPQTKSTWSASLSSLMKRSWSIRIDQRPRLDQVCATLRDEVSHVRGDEANDILDASNKSLQSLRGSS